MGFLSVYEYRVVMHVSACVCHVHIRVCQCARACMCVLLLCVCVCERERERCSHARVFCLFLTSHTFNKNVNNQCKKCMSFDRWCLPLSIMIKSEWVTLVGRGQVP